MRGYVECHGEQALAREVALQLATHLGDKGARDDHVMMRMQIRCVTRIIIVAIIDIEIVVQHNLIHHQ